MTTTQETLVEQIARIIHPGAFDDANWDDDDREAQGNAKGYALDKAARIPALTAPPIDETPAYLGGAGLTVSDEQPDDITYAGAEVDDGAVADAVANRGHLVDLLRREAQWSGVWFAKDLSKAADLLAEAMPGADASEGARKAGYSQGLADEREWIMAAIERAYQRVEANDVYAFYDDLKTSIAECDAMLSSSPDYGDEPAGSTTGGAS